MDFYDTLWDRALEFRSKNLIESLEIPIKLPNSYALQEYTLTHKYQNSKNAFVGHDLESTSYQIKILACDSYNHAKEIHQIIRPLQPVSQELRIVEIQDIFEMYDDNNWFVVLVTELVEGLSLEEIVSLLREHNSLEKLTKDSCIYSYIWLLDIIESAEQKGICFNSIFPDSVLMCRGPISSPSILTTSRYSYNLRVSVTGNYALNSGISRLDHIYPCSKYKSTLMSDIWGLGLCLFTLCGNVTLNDLPNLREISDKERIDTIKIRFDDIAIDVLIKDSLREVAARAPFNHPYTKVWRGLWLNDWNMIDSCTIRELLALRSGLFFENQSSQFLSLRKILSLGEIHSSEIYENLSSAHLMSDFLQLCMKYNWEDSKKLIDSVFLIMQYKPATHGFQEQLVDIGFLGIIPIALELEVTPNILYEFAKKFIDDNTLTLLQILWDSGLANKALRGDKTDTSFIKATISYYGPNSIDIMKEALKSEQLNEFRVLQAMLEVPFYFKLEKHDILIELLTKIVVKGIKNQNDYLVDILKNTVLILAEILSLPKVLQYHHISGQCTSHSNQQFISYVGKNPLLIYCIDCNISLCTVCYHMSHYNHNRRFLLYLNPHFRCNCEEKHDDIPTNIEMFKLPKYNERFLIMLSDGNVVNEKHYNHFRSHGDMTISTQEPLVSNWNSETARTLAYFEIKILKAGKYENISIELLGTGVSYKGSNGKIIQNGLEVSLGPRYGSWDTVGIGMTHNYKVFVTYNGLLVHPMIECSPENEIRPLIKMEGDSCEIEFKLRSWMFQPVDSPSQSLFSNELFQKSKHILDNLFNQIKKVCRKNSKDRKCQDLIQKFLELLESVNDEELMSKTRKEIKRTFGSLSS